MMIYVRLRLFGRLRFLSDTYVRFLKLRLDYCGISGMAAFGLVLFFLMLFYPVVTYKFGPTALQNIPADPSA